MPARVCVDVRVVGGVTIEWSERVADEMNVRQFMCAYNGVVFYRKGFLPCDLDFPLLAQQRQRAGHSLRPLGMAGLRVGKAAFIGDHVHGRVWRAPGVASTVNTFGLPSLVWEPMLQAVFHGGL